MDSNAIRGRITDRIAEAQALVDIAEVEDRGLSTDELAQWEEIAGTDGHVEKLKTQLAVRERQEALLAETRQSVSGLAIRPGQLTKNPEAEVPQEERKEYSLHRVLQGLKSNVRGSQLEGFEGEVHNHLAGSFGHEARGIYIPYWALFPQTRAVMGGLQKREIGKVAPTTAGATLVGVDHLAESFIELLRNATMVGQAGATILPGLVGDVSIPKQLTAATNAWQATEGADITPSDSTYGAVTLNPKTAAAITDMTRTMQKQSTPAIEDLVRADLAQVIAIAIDDAAINGDGAARTPLGIINTIGINVVDAAITGGLGWTWAAVVEAEKVVAEDNALRGTLAYMYPASVMGLSKVTEKAAASGHGFLEDAGGTMNGYTRYVTQQVPAQTAIFANWADLLIGQWGGLDMFADPYTVGDSGSLRIRAFQDVDVAVRHPVSFAHIHDIGAA